METELESKISDILSSPEDLQKIMSIVGSLGLGKKEDIEAEVIEKESHDATESTEKLGNMSELEKLFSQGKQQRLSLLTALKPYLKDSKRDKLETVMRLLNAAEILFSAKNFL
ncbi:MAG: hypothetical protein IJP16_10590 [Clostridia bacterium]|nr:hypothetical protein [Clostridia bacterium]